MVDLIQEVRNIIRDKNWMVLATVNKKGIPQSSVVMYASDGKTIYVSTGKNSLKVKNIKQNKHVAVTIPFRKNFLHQLIKKAPPAEIHFKGEAEILPYSNEEARKFFSKMIGVPDDLTDSSVWLKIKPTSKIASYGVGIGFLKMRNPEMAGNIIQLPE
jgi:hypothetical protein